MEFSGPSTQVKTTFNFLQCTFCPCFHHLLLEEACLNNLKINELESLHVEIYHYVLGNRGIYSLTFVVHVLLIVISPSNVL